MGAPQGSEGWFRDRIGHCTASRFGDVLARGKNGASSTSRRNYRTQLVLERLTSSSMETFKNAATQWGNDIEPAARREIEVVTGHTIMQTGFVKSTIPWVGCSPDGLIGNDALVQIKCPFVSAVHLETMERGFPSEHVAQVQGELWVTGRKWCLFSSFDPRMPQRLRLYTHKVERDETYISKLETEIHIFLREVEEAHRKLLNK